MENKFMRFLSLLLAFVMVLGMFPVTHAHARQEIGEPIAEMAAGTYVIRTAGVGQGVNVIDPAYLTSTASGVKLALSTTEQPVWTVAVADEAAGTYYVTDSNGNYLNVVSNGANMTESATALKLYYGTAGDAAAAAGFYIADSANGQKLNYQGGIATAEGRGGTGSWAIWQFLPVTEVEGCEQHTEEIIPAVPATLDAPGKTEGKKCAVCGEILLPQEDVPALYNDGIVPNGKLTATAGSIEEGNDAEGSADFALDDDFGTMWHTDWDGTDAEKLWIDFALEGNYNVTALRYKPRSSGSNGVITKYQILVSYDGENYVQITSGEWANDALWKVAEFDAKAVKNVRLFAVESIGDHRLFASAAEVRLVGQESDHTHAWEDKVEEVPATCTTPGSRVTVTSCTGCNAVLKRATEDLGVNSDAHGETRVEDAVKPTLCTPGATGTTVCVDCGAPLTESTAITQIPVAAVLNGDKLIALSDCEYTYNGTSLTHFDEVTGNTYTVKPASFNTTSDVSGKGGQAPQTISEWTGLTLAWQENGSVWIEGNGSLHIWTSLDKPYWDKCGGGHGDGNNGTHDLYLFVAGGEGAEIPGYTRVSNPGEADLANGSYLIAAKKTVNDQTVWYVMVPSASNNAYDHIALVSAEMHTTGHTPGAVVVENHTQATCTEAGYYDAVQYCTVCSKEAYRVRIVENALGHSTVDIAGTPATCTAEGLTEGKQCCVCLVWTTSQEVIPALGHDWVGGVYTEPTFESDGYTTYTCANGCGETKVTYAEGTKLIAVAQASEKKFETLAEAFAVGGRIVLLADVELTERLTVSTNIMLELGSYSITGDFADDFGMIYVKNGASLAIAGEGSITATASTAIGNYGTVRIDGGTITGGTDPVYGDLGGVYNYYYGANYYGTTTVFGGNVDVVLNCGKLYVQGGEIGCIDNSGYLQIANGSVAKIYAQDGSDAPEVENAGKIAIWAQQFDLSTIIVPEGYELVKGDDGLYEVRLVHVHDYKAVVTEPTCTTGGYTTYTCDCGDTYTDDVTDPKPHTEETVPGKAPTCTEPGLTAGTKCSDCGKTLIPQETIPAGHVLVTHVEANAATCTESGNLEYWFCFTCGKAFLDEELTDETTLEDVVIKAKGHYYEIVGVAPSTCTEGGFTLFECWDCGHQLKGDLVDAAGHTEETIPAVEPTCTETGLTEGTKCSVCGETLVEQTVVGALGHTEGETVVENNVDPTCTEAGSYENVVYCTVCGEELSRETITVAAKGHRYSSVVVTPATCTEYGYVTITCGDCGKTFVSGVDAEADQYLIDNPYFKLDPKGHTEVVDAAKASTCTETGLTEGKHCSVCGEVLVEQTVVDALGHTEGETVVENKVEADCVNAGSYDNVVYCTTCGEELSRETVTVAALGHSYYNLVVTPATCTEDGYITITCRNCEKTFVSGVDAEADQYLIDYPFFDLKAKGHTEETIPSVDATCTETGLTEGTKCSVCGEILVEQEVVPAKGHNARRAVKENEVPATCTTDGSYDTVSYCLICDYEMRRETITVPATGHTEGAVVIENNVAPTCTENGSYDNVVYCTVCGEELSRETITVAALGHTEGETVVENNVAPTCTENGSYDNVVYCTVCGEELSRETITVDALGHTEVVDAAKAPTCTETGLTEGKHCSVCGEVLVEQTVVAALGHTAGEAVKENEVPSTCTEYGSYDSVVYCSVCNEELNRETVEVEPAHNLMQKDYVLFCRVCGEIYTGFFRDSLYIEGKLISAYQLYKYEGNWYFISDAHKIARSTRVYLGEQYVTGKTYDGVRPMQPGYYEFDENGYMVIPEMKNGVIDGYLYINDVKQTAYKLVAFDGSYYFISDYNKVVVDCKVYLNAQFLVGTEYEGHVGYYEFDADGKLVKAPEWKEGEINGYLYIDNVMQTAYQLVEYDGNIYFISDAHKIAKSCRLFLGAGFTEPMGLPAGYYEFDANGHMIRG